MAGVGVGLHQVNALMGDTLQLASGLIAVALGLGVPEVFSMLRKEGPVSEDETQRGSELATPKDVAKLVKAQKKPTDLVLGGVPFPVDAEPYHLLVAGSTGTGKSVALSSMIARLRERGDTVILVDSGGDFTAKFFKPETDFVFNPYDERCVGWSPVLEMQGAWDAQALARSIVPDGVGETKEWNGYAQTFIGSVLRRLWETQRLTLADFLYFVQVAPIPELKELLAGTASASQLASEKMFGSIRSIASNYLAAYDYLPHDRQPFSVTEMIQAQHSGTLFITYRDDQLDSLRNIIACLLDVASRAVLSLTPNPQRRVWLIIDEFASIGRVQSVEAVATKARKAGGCLVLGIQSISQLRDRYGDNGAQTILSCLSTWLVLRCSDADTAEYMSRYIGEAEVLRVQQGSSSNDTGDTKTSSEQRLTKRVVLASEIQQFPNLTGLLKVPGGIPVCKIKLDIPTHIKPTGAIAFQGRDFSARPLLDLTVRSAKGEAGTPESSKSAVSVTPPVEKVNPWAEPRKEVERIAPATKAFVAEPPKPLSSAPARKYPKSLVLSASAPAPSSVNPKADMPRSPAEIAKLFEGLPKKASAAAVKATEAPKPLASSEPAKPATPAQEAPSKPSAPVAKPKAPPSRRGRRGGSSGVDLTGLLR